MGTAAILFDSTRCIGCAACVGACKAANGLPAAVDPRLTAYTWTVVERWGEAFVRRMCMHCQAPACASVCPVGALRKTAAGPVVYEASRCMGCRYCILACPFEVPRYQWDRTAPVIGKCSLCADRLAVGQAPACAAACPTGATRFGGRAALVAEAQGRMAAAPEAYTPHVYGLDEVGGTSVLMLAAVPFARLTRRLVRRREPLPPLTWSVLARVPDLVVVGGALLYGVCWITHRRVRLMGPQGPADRGSP